LEGLRFLASLRFFVNPGVEIIASGVLDELKLLPVGQFDLKAALATVPAAPDHTQETVTVVPAGEWDATQFSRVLDKRHAGENPR
jgi:hypothetical protein